jgi:hypothetical protein
VCIVHGPSFGHQQTQTQTQAQTPDQMAPKIPKPPKRWGVRKERGRGGAAAASRGRGGKGAAAAATAGESPKVKAKAKGKSDAKGKGRGGARLEARTLEKHDSTEGAVVPVVPVPSSEPIEAVAEQEVSWTEPPAPKRRQWAGRSDGSLRLTERMLKTEETEAAAACPGAPQGRHARYNPIRLGATPSCSRPQKGFSASRGGWVCVPFLLSRDNNEQQRTTTDNSNNEQIDRHAGRRRRGRVRRG